MEDILLTENTSKAFKESIFKSLNTNTKDLNNKINEELISTYIENVLTKELLDIDEKEKLLNPMIVKLSKTEMLYNKFASNLLNLSYNDYLKSIKKLISSKKELPLIKKYAIDNLSILDYQNPIELEISSIYANLILKNNLKTTNEQIWFVNYIIKKEAYNHKLNPNIVCINIKKKKKCILIKNSPYKYYNNLDTIDDYSNDVYINLGLYNLIKKNQSNKSALVYLLNKCFKALQKQIRKNNEYSITYNDTMYRFIKEGIIYKEDNNFYNRNKSYFSTEINMQEETDNMTKALLDNPLFSNFDFLNDFNEKEDYASYKNTKDYLEVDSHIDNILINNPSIIKDYPLLQMEYNENGSRKNIKELINVKNKQLEFFNEQINNFNEILSESDNDIIKDNIQNKLEKITNGLPGIIRCHNSMIYKSLRVLSIPDFSKLLTNLDDNYINNIKEVINQEKNDIIKKLENNRSKIFKPTTFLKNDEFLTKEYSRVASYESRIHDYEIEKETLVN